MLKNIQLWKEAPVWDEASIHVGTKTWFKYLDQPLENSGKTAFSLSEIVQINEIND